MASLTPLLLLALACLALALNVLAFWINWRLSRRVDALPRPFWMGEWPPRWLDPER